MSDPRGWYRPRRGSRQVPHHHQRGRGVQPRYFPRHQYGDALGFADSVPHTSWNPGFDVPGHHSQDNQTLQHPSEDFQCQARSRQSYTGSSCDSRYPYRRHHPLDSYQGASSRGHTPRAQRSFQDLTNPQGQKSQVPPPSRTSDDRTTAQLEAIAISSNVDAGDKKQTQDVSTQESSKDRSIRPKEVQRTPAVSTPLRLETNIQEECDISSFLSSTPHEASAIAEAYSAEQKYLLRLMSIHMNVSKNVLHRIFLMGHKRFLDQLSKNPKLTLYKHYEAKGVKVKIFWKNLNDSQREKLERDPKGSTFDVTLLYICIQYGNDGVEHEDLDKWKESDQNLCLESSITSVKNRRNNVYHRFCKCDSKDFVDQTNRLGELLEMTLKYAGDRYDVSSEVIKSEVDHMHGELIAFRDKSFTAQNLEDYKREVPLEEFSEFVNAEGKKELFRQYETMKRNIITPVNHLADINFHVRNIFTQMVIKGTASQDIELENMLENVSKDGNKHLFLLEGIAGVGKSTLSKKILEDWIHPDQNMIKHLDEYDFLLLTECRSRSISSFIGLLQSLMPNTSRRFKPEDFRYIVFSQRILVLLDGLDEINDQSTKLFQEILDLKSSHNIDVMVTTRPEKIEYYFRLVNPLHLETKHIELLGIAGEVREEFVCKYHSEMGLVTSEDIPYIDGLLVYLLRTRYRLDDLWRLPYNLALVVILWVHNSSVVNTITTSSELYWEIHLLCLSKLKERLSRHHMTSHLNELSLDHKVDYFIKRLSKEALVGLVDDDINLAGKSLNNLEIACLDEKIPHDEMIGAFLKKVITKSFYGYDVRFSYPHKGLQDFLGSIHIFSRFGDEWKDHENHDVINDYLEELHGSKHMDITKFQNLLIILIGVIYLHQNRPRNSMVKINDNVKRQILDLVKATGVISADSWLKILDSVKCDKFVASYISEISGILRNVMSVKDSSIFAYISLLSALPATELVEGNLKMKLDLKEDAGISELLPHIARLELPVESINFEKEVMKFSSAVAYEEDINKIFLKNPEMLSYCGALTAEMEIPRQLRKLFVCIPDQKAFQSLITFLELHTLTHLWICFRKDFDLAALKPLPFPKPSFSCIYIVGIDSNEAIGHAWKMINRIQPTDGKKHQKLKVAFPKARLTLNIVRGILQALKKKHVDFAFPLLLPSYCKEHLGNKIAESSKWIVCVNGEKSYEHPLINDIW